MVIQSFMYNLSKTFENTGSYEIGVELVVKVLSNFYMQV